MDRIHSHGRWLRRLAALRGERQRREAEKEDAFDLPALHRSLAIKRRAIPILVAFARELAGVPEPLEQTVEKDGTTREAEAAEIRAEAEEAGGARRFRLEKPANALPPAADGAPARKWTKTHRPGPFDVLTWEEAMQVPWIEGDEARDLGSDES
jgi:hypothetical protein